MCLKQKAHIHTTERTYTILHLVMTKEKNESSYPLSCEQLCFALCMHVNGEVKALESKRMLNDAVMVVGKWAYT